MELFQQSPYQQQIDTRVIAVNERGGILIEDNLFYPTGGGQPGDSGTLSWNNQSISIETTVRDRESGQIILVPDAVQHLPEPGQQVSAVLDWETRHQHMRMHTAMHLLCSVIPCGVTGGQVGATKSRLDFDVGDFEINKPEVEEKMNALIDADHPVSTRWITDEELDQNPALVKTLSVQPPRGQGRIRLLQVGNDDSIIDLQPCGGTHVKSTFEIGRIRIGKIENKGKRNKRVNLHFDES